MSDNPVEDQRLDNDPTDELPILLETAVLDPEEHRVGAVVHVPGEDETGEHTMRFAALRTPADEDALGGLDALRTHLQEREAKIATLENDIGRLSSRWLDVERHLTEREGSVAELEGIVTTLRASLAERSAAEQRLTTEIADREGQFNRLLDDIDRLRRDVAAAHAERTEAQAATQTASAELAQARATAQTAAAELAQARAATQTAVAEVAALQAAAAARPDPAAESDELQRLREELATLAHSIGNRRALWDELETRAAASARRVAELESELGQRSARQAEAEALVRRETVRATHLRSELVERSRQVEVLERETRALRGPADRIDRTAQLRAQLDAALTAGAARERERETANERLAAEAVARTRIEEALAAALAAAATRERDIEIAAAQLAAESSARARAEEALAAALTAAATRDREIETAIERLAAEAAARARAEEALAAALDAAKAAPAPLPVEPPRALAVAESEILAQLEAELEHQRGQLAGNRASLHDQGERLAVATAELEQLRRQLTEARSQLEHKRNDSGRLERALIDKDRALEVRDERIATLQAELEEKLGALQRLNAMDLSLQGLDSKMSERLKRAEPPTEATPALICLTSDQPKQYAINKKTMTIGRSSLCDIQILTHFVSREHARLTIGRGGVVIEDLGSTNGVFVNSVRIERHELRHSDLVTVGETQFRFLETMAH